MPRQCGAFLRVVSWAILALSLQSCKGLGVSEDIETDVSPFEKVVAGASHFCGLDDQGDIYCWEDTGALSVSSFSKSSGISKVALEATVKVPQGQRGSAEKFVSLDAGDYHTCATTDEGNAYCWGAPSSALGDGSSSDPAYAPPENFNDSLFPRHVPDDGLPAGDEFLSVHLGRNHSCGVTKYGNIYCWGSGVDGGDDASTPVSIPGGVLPSPPPAPEKSQLCDGKVLDVNPGPASCPYGFQYVYDAPYSYCVQKDVALPPVNTNHYCHYVNDGYLGFQWDGEVSPNGFVCPFGYRLAPNTTGQFYCVFDGIERPAGVDLKPHCDLPAKTVGYKWCSSAPASLEPPSTPEDLGYVCPDGFTKSYDGQYNFCIQSAIVKPPTVTVNNYCLYITSGYLGFNWFGNPSPLDYVCPTGFYKTQNEAGTYYCLKTSITLPVGADVKPHCHVDEGFVGFRW